MHACMHWRRKWQPLQCSCLENPRDRGAWSAAIYGVAQSQTLKRQQQQQQQRKLFTGDVIVWRCFLWRYFVLVVRKLLVKVMGWVEASVFTWQIPAVFRCMSHSTLPVTWILRFYTCLGTKACSALSFLQALHIYLPLFC